jgi:hypothetical protein
VRAELEEEGDGLVRFVEEDASAFEARFEKLQKTG